MDPLPSDATELSALKKLIAAGDVAKATTLLKQIAGPGFDFDHARTTDVSHPVPEQIAHCLLQSSDGPSSNGAQYWNDLGLIFHSAGFNTEAVAAFRNAVDSEPKNARYRYRLGLALKLTGEFREAVRQYQAAAEIEPAFVEALSNLGNTLRLCGEFDQAIAAYERALALRPADAIILSNLGLLVGESGRLEDGIALCRQAIALQSQLPEAHLNLSLLLLTNGQFEEGWREFEWRLRCVSVCRPLHFGCPRWDGGSFRGRTILLHSEQGFGDMIQFARFVPRVVDRGGKVIVAVPNELRRLLKDLYDAVEVVPISGPLPAFDAHCPLMSLPFTLPCSTPIPPDLAPRSLLRQRPDAPKESLRIGLAWAGKPTHENDRFRSIRLNELRPLAESDATFESLQVGSASQEIRELHGWHVTDHSEELIDFAATAKLLERLDLVVTVDSAVAHLAGTLNVPTYVLLPHSPDWRWRRDTAQSPWYPSIRLFRQDRPGDWTAPIAAVADALKEQAGFRKITQF